MDKVIDLHAVGYRNLVANGPKIKRCQSFFKARISYQTSRCSPTYQVHTDRAVLLIISGDISPNPGPSKNTSSVCKRSVGVNHRALNFDSCNQWCHIGKRCGKVSVSQYKEYKKVDHFNRRCPVCAMSLQTNNENTTNYYHHVHTYAFYGTAFYDPAFTFPFKEFSFFHLNLRSILPKIDEVRQLASENPFHILTFSETWLLNCLNLGTQLLYDATGIMEIRSVEVLWLILKAQ